MNEILEELKVILKTALGGTFATYEIGRRDLVGRSELPLLCVYPRSTRELRSGNNNDNASFEIGVMAILTVRESNNQPRNARANTQHDLIQAFEGRDSSGKAEANTVLGTLNGNLTIGGTVLYTDEVRIAYDSEFDGKALTERASLVFTAKSRPPR